MTEAVIFDDVDNIVIKFRYSNTINNQKYYNAKDNLSYRSTSTEETKTLISDFSSNKAVGFSSSIQLGGIDIFWLLWYF